LAKTRGASHQCRSLAWLSLYAGYWSLIAGNSRLDVRTSVGKSSSHVNRQQNPTAHWLPLCLHLDLANYRHEFYSISRSHGLLDVSTVKHPVLAEQLHAKQLQAEPRNHNAN